MLESLFINNIAVIEKAEIDFAKGFNVLTGETGAGKSIIIDAIGAVLGERTSKDLIRTGSDKASVTAMFDVSDKAIVKAVEDLGVDMADGQLQLYREIRQNGKTICKINGTPVTTAMLKDVGVKLVAVHGQHDSYELLSTDIHGKYLDAYGKLETLLGKYLESFNQLKIIKKQLDLLSDNEEEKERRRDLLIYQIEEIESVDIKIGEKDELVKRRDLIRNSANVSRSISAVRELLNGDGEADGIISMVETAAEELDSVSSDVDYLETCSEKLRDVEYALQDIGRELREKESLVEFDEGELEEAEDRIDLLYKLSLKYGKDEQEILDKLELYKKELADIEMSGERIEELSAEFESYKTKAIALAKELSVKRKECAVNFAEKVKENLKFLNMPNVDFSVQLERCNLYNGGCDKIQFMVSANSGEAPKPMSKIASGGELSRIMLAIKAILSKDAGIDTMIFDEIDTGISGEAANKVGKKIKELSSHTQVLCITHLAQIAAMANNHLFINKQTSSEKTYTSVETLDTNGRIDELARIIGGDEITDTKRTMAKEMLDN